MDHDDWSHWSADGGHPDDADTADLHGGSTDEHGLADFAGHEEHDLGGHDLGAHELDDQQHEPHPGGDQPGHAGFPEDDPFGDGGHEAGAHGGALDFTHDGGPDHEGGADPHDDVDPHDVDGPVEHLVGADPDLDPHADDAGWDAHEFPPHLDLAEVPAPVDGFPWSDPHVLGGGVDDAAHLQSGWAPPPASELLDYAGLEESSGAGTGDAWQALLGSDDPATSALARWWAPGS